MEMPEASPSPPPTDPPTPASSRGAPVNIAMVLEMAADAFGDRVAIGSGDDGLTYAELRRARGPSPSASTTGRQHLALIEPNGPLVPAALFGAAWAGVSYAPLNYRLPDAALHELIARIQPSVAAGPTGSTPRPSERAFPDAPELPAVLLFTSGTSAAPKAAVLEHDQLLAYMFNTVEFGSAGEDEAALMSCRRSTSRASPPC